MNDYHLNLGIQFENTNIFIPWKTRNKDLVKIGNPKVEKDSEEVTIYWPSSSLLYGLVGDWEVMYYNHKKYEYFYSIGLLFAGDDIAFKKYDEIKNHITATFGLPDLIKEEVGEKRIKWVLSEVELYLYLFEMHEFRVTFDIINLKEFNSISF
jgi:hypothetical protein